MKAFMFAVGMVIVYVIFLTYQLDNNTYIRELERLKQTADECAASASLYYDISEMAEGNMVFDRDEGKKVTEYILQKNLQLDNLLQPLITSYWQEVVEYDIYFYDDSNTSFPHLYIDQKTSYQRLLTEPTVIVTLKSKPRFRLDILTPPDAIRTSAYEYYER